MKIEIRHIQDYRKDCTRIQFYLMQPNPSIFDLEQSPDPEAQVVVLGNDLLFSARARPEDTIYVYIVGIQDDGQLFVFEPWQDIIKVDRTIGLRLKGVQLPGLN